MNVDLAAMEIDAARMRGGKPFAFTDLSRGKGVEEIVPVHRRTWWNGRRAEDGRITRRPEAGSARSGRSGKTGDRPEPAPSGRSGGRGMKCREHD